MRERPQNALSIRELTDLCELEADLRRLCKRWRRLVERLGKPRRSPDRVLAADRLLCVLHDGLRPALRDVRSITAEAREPRE